MYISLNVSFFLEIFSIKEQYLLTGIDFRGHFLPFQSSIVFVKVHKL